ncbi:MAG: DNA translocase FtsK 4TM domain-containing protein [Rickettsiales bacterium]|nr:DNA translocase FtsK 4TM domain-containing protein [Rickettsiales bacterium]
MARYQSTTKYNKKFSLYSISSGIFYLCIAVTLLLSLISYSPNDVSFSYATNNTPKNFLGKFGSYTIDFLLQSIGLAVTFFILVPFIWGIKNIFGYPVRALWFRIIILMVSILSFAGLLFNFEFNFISLPLISTGGTIGSLFSPYLNLIPKQFSLYIESGVTLLLLYLALDIRVSSVYSCLKAFGILLWKSLLLCFYGIKISLRNCIRTIKHRYNHHNTNEAEIEEDQDKEKLLSVFKTKPISRQNTPIKETDSTYALPKSDLLKCYKQSKNNISRAILKNNAAELIKILNDFGVKGNIENYFPGPVITLYELEPAAGTKSSRVINLSDDIARTMRAISTRVSIIPGKNSLGIELPNKIREFVYLKELVESEDYISAEQKLPIILGKDIGGKVAISDLVEMPHLLVAGTTGSGKSVAINAMILSLLFKHTPETCKFIMIDPKMLELSVYDGIPHLLTPVVTESRKAVSALKWVVREMENRYRVMSYLGVRNVHGYNQKIKAGVDLNRQVQVGFDQETGNPIYETVKIENKILPFIVVIVDEMADLMIVSGKEIEASVQRLAQMARAAGIHIIMATQRPSVDVITGVIKANFPTRIAFQVSSKIDSRTILGEMGAEQLLGKGDMLLMSGGNKIKRIHGAFVDDSEVTSIVSFWKSQGKPDYRTDIMLENKATSSDGLISNSHDQDDLYSQAVALIQREKKVSISYLQRCFKIGYNKSASIVEQMEQEGIVSKPNHMGRREVLIKDK